MLYIVGYLKADSEERSCEAADKTKSLSLSWKASIVYRSFQLRKWPDCFSISGEIVSRVSLQSKDNLLYLIICWTLGLEQPRKLHDFHTWCGHNIEMKWIKKQQQITLLNHSTDLGILPLAENQQSGRWYGISKQSTIMLPREQLKSVKEGMLNQTQAVKRRIISYIKNPWFVQRL